MGDLQGLCEALLVTLTLGILWIGLGELVDWLRRRE